MADVAEVKKTEETKVVDKQVPSARRADKENQMARNGRSKGRKSDEGRWEDAMGMAFGFNLKDLTGDHHNYSRQAILRSQDLQEKINAQFLENSARNSEIVNRRGQNGATVDAFANVQMLAQSMQNAALGADVVESAKSAAKQIIDTAAANAATAATSAQGATMLTTAPAQGATGVAQAAGQEASMYAASQAQLNAVYQSNQAILNAIIQAGESNRAMIETNRALGDSLVQIATNAVEVNKSLAVLLVEVTGKAVVTPVTSTTTA